LGLVLIAGGGACPARTHGGSLLTPHDVIRAATRALRGEAQKVLQSAPVAPPLETVLQSLEVGNTEIDRGARLTLPAI